MKTEIKERNKIGFLDLLKAFVTPNTSKEYVEVNLDEIKKIKEQEDTDRIFMLEMEMESGEKSKEKTRKKSETDVKNVDSKMFESKETQAKDIEEEIER